LQQKTFKLGKQVNLIIVKFAKWSKDYFLLYIMHFWLLAT
jgi:hypothetical protein